MDTKIDFKDPAYYENRELSWIKFDQRVLSEARDKSIPLLERLKFVSITSSNLDEFFMVRVASLKDMVHAKYKKRDIAGMTATEQLSAINKQAPGAGQYPVQYIQPFPDAASAQRRNISSGCT